MKKGIIFFKLVLIMFWDQKRDCPGSEALGQSPEAQAASATVTGGAQVGETNA